ncbi:MAG: flagellar basal body rod protein FlgB [Rickettsiales bacterium]|nr:flagellar basal body rod protein FlgB [Rickettsiales bacterium]
MKTKLQFLSERQGVLARNIANADTPGYKAQDLKAPDFAKLLKSAPARVSGQSAQNLPMAVTHAGHMAPMTAATNMEMIDRPMTDELNPNGNNVVIEEEMSKVASNQGEYTTAMNLYAKTVAMFKTAIGNPSGG